MASAQTLFAVSGGGGGRGFNQIQSLGQAQPLGDYSPDVQAKLAQAERKRQIANLLVQRGMQGGPTTTQAGRFLVPRGIAQNMGDLATMLAGVYGNYQADQQAQEAIAEENRAYEQAIQGYKARISGITDQAGVAARPAIPAQPATTMTGQSEDENVYLPPTAAQPAVEAVPSSTAQKQQAILESLLQSRIPAVQRYGFQQQVALDADVAREEAREERLGKITHIDLGDRVALMRGDQIVQVLPKAADAKPLVLGPGQTAFSPTGQTIAGVPAATPADSWTVHEGGDGYMYRTNSRTGQSEPLLVNGRPMPVPIKEQANQPFATDKGFFQRGPNGTFVPVIGPGGDTLQPKPTPQAVHPVPIADPADRNKTIVVNANLKPGDPGYLIGEGPRATDIGKETLKATAAQQKASEKLRGLGDAIDLGRSLLSGVGVDPATGLPRIGLPTASGIGSLYDKGAAWFGAAPIGAQQAASLKAVEGDLVRMMPRMEGPQSNLDVMLYKEMAGKIGDDTLPIATRQAALATVEKLWRKYEPTGTANVPSPAAAGAKGGVVKITNDAEHAALPSGTIFIGPDGQTRKKP